MSDDLICSECGKIILPDEYHVSEHAPPNPPVIKCVDCSNMGVEEDEWEDTREL